VSRPGAVPQPGEASAAGTPKSARPAGAGAPSAWQRWRLPAVAAFSLAAVAAALVSQHVFDMLPCPWCVFQRLVFITIAAAALLAWALPVGTARRAGAALVGALAGVGIASALWQYLVAAQAEACVQTLAERIVAFTRLDHALPDVFVAWASCADAAVDLLGLPYEFWSLAGFIGIAAVAVMVLRDGR
jgi:protein dithiol:quinone oxidoreductase